MLRDTNTHSCTLANSNLCVSSCGSFAVTAAMCTQSQLNEFEAETFGLRREAELTQLQLALHAQRDRAEWHRELNLGLAEGAAGLAESATAVAEGDWVAKGNSLAEFAKQAQLRAQAYTGREEELLDLARGLPSAHVSGGRLGSHGLGRDLACA